MTRSTVLVTGASSGIGLELATLAAADGHDLVLVARSSDKLETVASALKHRYGVGCLAVTLDLSAPGACMRLVEQLAARKISVGILVNCAGFGMRGNFHSLSAAHQLDMIHVNMTSPTMLTRLLLPDMVARGTGAILNVSSVAAFTAGPHMSVYYASKAYVLALSEGLHEELRGSGVTVSCLCPGTTATGFATRAGVGSLHSFRWTAMSAHDVACAGWQGMKQRRAVIIAGKRNRFAAFFLRYVPRALARKLTYALQRSRS